MNFELLNDARWHCLGAKPDRRLSNVETVALSGSATHVIVVVPKAGKASVWAAL
jgi:hypothetical protein